MSSSGKIATTIDMSNNEDTEEVAEDGTPPPEKMGSPEVSDGSSGGSDSE